MDSIKLLSSAFLDGELTDAEADHLSRVLEADAAALDRFVVNSFIHFQLLDWMDQEQVQDNTMSGAYSTHDEPLGAVVWPVSASMEDTASGPAVSRGTQRAGAARMRRRLKSLGALAAALLVAASITAVAYVIASRPVIVGQLDGATNCRWGASNSELRVGTLLQDGQELDLIRGSALITFGSGAQLLLESPTSLRLDSEAEVHLLSGRIAAKVPTQARGFTVTSSLARFIDLGTAFTLKLDPEKSFELHVFEGLVELRLDERFGGAANQPLRAAEVRAYSFDVQSGDVVPVHFQEGKQMPF